MNIAIRVSRCHMLKVKESMPQFAFSHSGFRNSEKVGGGGKKKKELKRKEKKNLRKPESQVLTQASASWRLMIPIQNCASLRVARKTVSFVGMKVWVSIAESLTSAEFDLFILAENLAMKLLVVL